ncbi:MAG: CaiB/BaiF CoA-transferase family protein [Thermoprotei archaeon]
MLEDIRVLEMGGFVSSPLAGMILADLGAEVIKIEPPSGDEGRRLKPPEIGGLSGYFFSLNRNKKSVVVDLKKPEGLEVFLDLVKSARVLISNYRPSVLEKLGIPPSKLISANPNLLLCVVSGYGSDGKWADKPAFDATILAESGLMHLTGSPDTEPSRFATPIADITTAMMATIAVVAGLHDDRKGIIEVPMLDTQLYLSLFEAYNYLLTGRDRDRMGSAHPNIVPYQAFKASDGYFYLACGTDKQFQEVCNTLGVTHLLVFDTNEKRVLNREKVVETLQAAFLNNTVEHWVRVLSGRGVPVSPILRVSDALNTEYIKSKNLLFRVKGPNNLELPYIKFPLRSNDEEFKIRIHPPQLGEHTGEVLRALGYSEEKITHLKAKRVIG